MPASLEKGGRPPGGESRGAMFPALPLKIAGSAPAAFDP